MAGLENNDTWQSVVRDAVAVNRENVSDAALDVLADALSTMRPSLLRSDLAVEFLSDPAVPYATAAKLFAAIKPTYAEETAAFLCRPDVPAVDAARIVASDRRTSVLRQVAELQSRGPEVYEAVVSAFGKAMSKASASPGAGFGVLSALLTNPDVPLASKTAAAAVPVADAWEECWNDGYVAEDSPVFLCWETLKASVQLQTAAFDGLTLPDSMLLDCASWQCLTSTQLRLVFAGLRRLASSRAFADVDLVERLLRDLTVLYDHAAADDVFLAEINDWFGEGPIDDVEDPDLFFGFTHRQHRRRACQHVDPVEFWASHPTGPLVTFELAEWSCWTRILSVPALVEVLAAKPDWSPDDVAQDAWLVSPATPLVSSAPADELLAGLDAAAATGIPDLLTVVEELFWWSASYEALTPDVLRRLRLSQHQSPHGTIRLLELLSATLGPDPELWQVFFKVSVPDATVGDILDLAAQLVDNS